jgi:CheY-like chemotaxis protein
VPLDPQLAWVRGVIDRQVTQMTRLVDDLLDVSRIATGKIRLDLAPVDLTAVAGQAVEAVRPLVETRKQELIFTPPARALWVSADASRMSQVISNLLNNAAKFTPERGQIRLFIEERDGWAHITVRDNGLGMAPETLPRIFDLFAQGESTEGRSHGGLGIGLTLVRNLVEMQGGNVQASSAGVGKGSEFVVRLPLLPRSVQTTSRPEEGAAARADVTSLRILIIDDNADAADSLELLLGRDGHQVRTCQDGRQALQISRAFRPQVVLLDIGLPGMDGIEAARELRRVPGLERATIVALTGHAGDDVRRDAVEAGIDRFWVKPIRLELLSELLASVGAQGAASDPSTRS